MLYQAKDLAEKFALPAQRDEGSAFLRFVSEDVPWIEAITTFSDHAINAVLGDKEQTRRIDDEDSIMLVHTRLVRIPVPDLRRPVSLLVVGFEAHLGVTSTLNTFAVLDPGDLWTDVLLRHFWGRHGSLFLSPVKRYMQTSVRTGLLLTN